ncbi:class I SAM-dependent methyltransferase [Nocardiopsis flavescens]|uniref:class I SAM-dependent methyltransferase n=1 Tax=Nocardiopsis flavescens TaxID=758803 RepID=UPI00364E1853
MRVPPHILPLLNHPEVTTDGDRLSLGPQPLDIGEWETLHELLKAAGEQSEPRARRNRFSRPAADVLAEMRTGHFEAVLERPHLPTPAESASKLLPFAELRPGARVLEPSAGDGALVRALADHGVDLHIDMVEKDPAHTPALRQLIAEGKATSLRQGDFLSLTPPPVFDLIVMAPPAPVQVLHIEHAYNCLAPGGHLVAAVAERFLHPRDPRTKRFHALVVEHGVSDYHALGWGFYPDAPNEQVVVTVLWKPTP